MSYRVVQFSDEDWKTVFETVSSHWFASDSCWWPPSHPNLVKLVTGFIAPDSETWTKYDAATVGLYSTYHFYFCLCNHLTFQSF
jgi:hypothetical protein